MQKKPMDVKDTADAREKVGDVEVFGNPDQWVLITKASSQQQGWMKSTKAMEVPGGVVLQVSTQVMDNVAEALVFVPGVEIKTDENGNRYLG